MASTFPIQSSQPRPGFGFAAMVAVAVLMLGIGFVLGSSNLADGLRQQALSADRPSVAAPESAVIHEDWRGNSAASGWKPLND